MCKSGVGRVCVRARGCRETEESTLAGDIEEQLVNESHVRSGSLESTDMNVCGKHLLFLRWNINGLLAKSSDRGVIQYITSFDIVCLVETVVDYFESCVFRLLTIQCFESQL